MLVTVAMLVSLGTLAYAGVTHVTNAARFRGAVAAQRVWPPRAVTPVAAAVTAGELFIGFGGLAAVLLEPENGTFRAIALVPAGGLYGVYALYAGYVLAGRSGAPCGCSSHEHPVNAAAVVRAALLAGAALLGALGPPPLFTQGFELELVLAVLASIALGVIAWGLPDALHDPTDGALARWAGSGA